MPSVFSALPPVPPGHSPVLKEDRSPLKTFCAQEAHLCTRKATWKRDHKLPWREAGPPNHSDDEVDSDQ